MPGATNKSRKTVRRGGLAARSKLSRKRNHFESRLLLQTAERADAVAPSLSRCRFRLFSVDLF